MNLDNIRQIYFLGIGGIGMSALARYFHARGIKVSGYDKTSTPLTQQLETEGINVHYIDDINQIPSDIDFVVYTPAIPKDNKEYLHILSNKTPILKRSEVLGIITRSSFTIAVAGTHGKTTVSSMIAHLLRHANIDISAFIGGITQNYQTNILLSNTSNITVVEADEFDRSFLTLSPDIAVVTSMDADHLDIYGAKEQLEESFHLFIDKIKENGKLIIREGLDSGKRKDINKYGYSQNNGSQRAENIRIENGRYVFDYNGLVNIDNIILGTPVKYNIENITAAITVGLLMGIESEVIKTGVESYKGVKRRFEYHINREDFVYIDDYAHHPAELKASISSARDLFPNKKITGVFQPHLFTRTRDFADDFCRSLELLDEVILLDIYPARELPIPGVTSKMLLDNITSSNKHLFTKEELIDKLKDMKLEVLITLGAGDIDQLVEPIRKAYNI